MQIHSCSARRRGVLPHLAACSPRRQAQGCHPWRKSRGCPNTLDFSMGTLPKGSVMLVSRRGSRPSQSRPQFGSRRRGASIASTSKGLGRGHRVCRWSPRVRHHTGEARASALRRRRAGHILPADGKQPLPPRGSFERIRRGRSAGRELSRALYQLAELADELVEHRLKPCEVFRLDFAGALVDVERAVELDLKSVLSSLGGSVA